MKPVVDAIDNKQFIAAEELISAALQAKINDAMVERKHEVANVFGQNIDEEKKDYEAFFEKAMKKFGISSPADLKTDEKKKEFFNYVDKNFKAKNEEFEISEEAGGTGDPGGNSRQQYAGQQDAIQLIMQSMIEDDFDYEAFFQTPEGQEFLDLYDYNGDGTISFADLQILLSMEGAGLPFMDAADYIKYMASDARSGRKQKAGAQIQIGTTKGSSTSRPPAAPPAPPATGTSMR